MSEIDDAPEFIEPLGPPRTFRQLAAAYDWRMGGCDARVAALEAENAALRAALETARIPHLDVEGDPFFSCPMARGGSCMAHDMDGPCPCGCRCDADDHNARIDAALAAARPDQRAATEGRGDGNANL